jgi:hypothetical protein
VTTTPQTKIPGDPSSFASRMCFPRSGLPQWDLVNSGFPCKHILSDALSSDCVYIRNRKIFENDGRAE